YPVDPEVLRADIAREILPLGMLGVVRGLHRVRADVAEATRHAYAIGADQILAVVVARVVVGSFGVPFLRRCLFEIRIREQAKPDDSRRISVVRTHGQLAVRQPASGADLYARVLLLVLERIGRAVRRALVEP